MNMLVVAAALVCLATAFGVLNQFLLRPSPGPALRRPAALRLARRPLSTAADPAAVCAAAIGSAPVVVFSRSWCPFCKQLEAVFGQAIAKELQPHVTFGAPPLSPRSPAGSAAPPAGTGTPMQRD